MSNEIDRWICSGAEVTEGLRLLSIYAPNKWLDTLVRKAPKEYSHLLRKALLQFATEVPLSQTLTKGGRFREDWPFLSEPDCPTELKALAADMITSWHNYVNAHEDQMHHSGRVLRGRGKNREKFLSKFSFPH